MKETNKKKPFLTILGTFELLVLLVMDEFAQQSLTTSTIRRILEDTSGKQVSIASLYVTLSRLKKKGYIDTDLMTKSRDIRGGKARNTYKILDKGRQAVEESYFKTIQKVANGLEDFALA